MDGQTEDKLTHKDQREESQDILAYTVMAVDTSHDMLCKDD